MKENLLRLLCALFHGEMWMHAYTDDDGKLVFVCLHCGNEMIY